MRPDLPYVIVRTMDKERIRFELRLKADERQALENLAEKHGVSMSNLVASWIRRKAKREKVWSYE